MILIVYDDEPMVFRAGSNDNERAGLASKIRVARDSRKAPTASALGHKADSPGTITIVETVDNDLSISRTEEPLNTHVRERVVVGLQ